MFIRNTKNDDQYVSLIPKQDPGIPRLAYTFFNPGSRNWEFNPGIAIASQSGAGTTVTDTSCNRPTVWWSGLWANHQQAKAIISLARGTDTLRPINNWSLRRQQRPETVRLDTAAAAAMAMSERKWVFNGPISSTATYITVLESTLNNIRAYYFLSLLVFFALCFYCSCFFLSVPVGL